jgi:hypothetical protein
VHPGTTVAGGMMQAKWLYPVWRWGDYFGYFTGTKTLFFSMDYEGHFLAGYSEIKIYFLIVCQCQTSSR